MIVVSLLLILVSGGLLATGILQANDPLVMASIGVSVLAAAALFLGIRQQRGHADRTVGQGAGTPGRLEHRTAAPAAGRTASASAGRVTPAGAASVSAASAREVSAAAPARAVASPAASASARVVPPPPIARAPVTPPPTSAVGSVSVSSPAPVGSAAVAPARVEDVVTETQIINRDAVQVEADEPTVVVDDAVPATGDTAPASQEPATVDPAPTDEDATVSDLTSAAEPETPAEPKEPDEPTDLAELDDEEDPPDEPAPELLMGSQVSRLSELDSEVLVVDGRPRYHLAGCPHLGDKECQPLPVSEAVELGFTACSLCAAATALLADATAT